MLTLVIVDDEFEIRNGLKNYFPWQELGFTVSATFSNGEEALDYIKNHDTDVILTDIKMPGLNGIELIKEIMRVKPKIKCIVISGFREFEYARQCLCLGVRDYLLKPTKYEELKEIFTKISLEYQIENNIGTGGSKSPSIKNIVEYINSNIKTVSLENVASAVGMNPYYLSHFFHQQTNEKFYDYVLRKKMEIAENLLINSTLSIQSISRQIGYTNSNSFSRVFRSYFGTNPKNYREKNEND